MAKRKKTRQQLETERFHATVVSLLRVRHADWTPWEHEWLLDQAQRPPNYVYSEKQWDILNQLVAYSKTVIEYCGYSIPELTRMAYRYRCDLDEDGQEFVDKVHRWNATDLKIRQARRLYHICRISDALPPDYSPDISIHSQSL
jgi:hypothetical protein